MTAQEQIAQPVSDRVRRDNLFAHLSRTPYRDLVETVASMPLAQAKKVWADLEPSFNAVGLKAGRGGISTAEWTSLYRKMAIFMRRAEADE